MTGLLPNPDGTSPAENVPATAPPQTHNDVPPGSPDRTASAHLPTDVAPGPVADVPVRRAERPRQIIRHGPGVPTAPGTGPPSADQVWRTGLPARRRHPVRRAVGPALTVVLLAASAAVLYLHLHHGPFGVTDVTITGQVRKGCTTDVTGLISTTGAAGTVSYQWVFQPQPAAPQLLSQSVAAGQSGVYVTAAIQGQGQGSIRQTVTLQVIEPGHASATAHMVVSC